MARLHKQHPHRLPEAITYGDQGQIPIRTNKVVLAAGQPTPTDPSHYHKESRQFFIALPGAVLVEVGDTIHTITPEHVLEIAPGKIYRVSGHVGDTTFLVVGTVNTKDDRVELAG